MTDTYSDIQSLPETLERVRERVDTGEEVSVTVLEAGQIKILDDDREELLRRNVIDTIGRDSGYQAPVHPIDDSPVTIGVTGTPALNLYIHQSAVENPLRLDPFDVESAPLPPARQATEPAELGPRIADALAPLEREYDLHWEFAGVEAQSMGNHFLTDWEFEYQAMPTEWNRILSKP